MVIRNSDRKLLTVVAERSLLRRIVILQIRPIFSYSLGVYPIYTECATGNFFFLGGGIL